MANKGNSPFLVIRRPADEENLRADKENLPMD
jgi:hypothetical protein